MRCLITLFTMMLGLYLGFPNSIDAVAQTTTTEQPPATVPTPTQSAPAPTPAPGPKAKDLDGLDVFGSDAQQIGKVAKVAVMPDGKVKEIEVHSSGFFGFFSKAYVVPADKMNLKNGRVELSMTSEQASQLVK
jgi:sporulation protein YlmC with PRC-barrel domain